MFHKKWTVQSIALVTLLLLAVVTAQASPLAAPVAPPGSTHTVNNIGDGSDANPGNGVCETATGNGICTLRAAIQEANARSGADKILFASSVGLIMPNSQLPDIKDPSGGTTVSGNPTWILGSFAGTAYGLKLNSNNNKLQGLYITNFSKDGVIVLGDNNIIGTDGDGANDASEGNVISSNGENGILILDDATGNRVAGNWIGLTFDGTGDAGNTLAGVKLETQSSLFDGARSNLIGTNGDGTSDELERNVISGNDDYGIHLTGFNTEDNVVAGNYIGTNAAGDASISNNVGIRITDGAMFNRIGTDGDGSTDELERNVISGNNATGVHILGLYADDNEVAGNYIGTNAAGSTAIANRWGVRIEDGASGNRVGLDNVISGNIEAEVYITGLDADYNEVAGNTIGTNAAGNAGLYIGSQCVGVRIDEGATHNLVGTDGDGAADELERNVISGNSGAGVRISGTGTDDNVVAGNYIGTRNGGYVRLYNGSGVVIENMAQNNRIGTDGDGTSDELERNVISGNIGEGVRLHQSTGNVIAGNYIGTDASGSGDLGNGGHGVEVSEGSGNTIGGAASGAANRIAFNDQDGIYVAESAYDNNLRGNVISANGELGIDLSPDGVTPNDTGDGDTGPNNLQNYPVLSSATLNGLLTTIQGTLNSNPSTTYDLDFYTNGSCDPSGYGEGSTYLGAKTVTTNASGDASFTTAFMNFIPAGTYVTATATDPDGNTSEFSQCLALISIGKPHIVVRPLTIDATLPSDGSVARALNATLSPSGSATRTLTISNTGSADLIWSLAESPAVGWLGQSPAGGTIAPANSADVTVSFNTVGPAGVLSPGTYGTTLRITSNDPDEPTVDVGTTLTVTEPCVPITGASFGYTPPAPQAGQPVTFDGSVTPSNGTPPITYAWDWGDGSPVQTGDPAIHTFAIAGTYSVVMTATNDCGQATATQEVTVSGIPDIEVSPLGLSATLNPDTTANRTLTISNTGTADLTWSLAESPGVGWLSEAPAGSTTAPAGSTDVTVGFDSAGLSSGTYSTTLHITSNDPDEATVDVSVVLTVATDCIPITGADFDVAPTPLVEGQVATFTATFAQGSESGLAYTWDFGDGSAPGLTNPISHTYAVHATYAVTLTIENTCGTDEVVHTLVVEEAPEDYFIYLPLLVRN